MLKPLAEACPSGLEWEGRMADWTEADVPDQWGTPRRGRGSFKGETWGAIWAWWGGWRRGSRQLCPALHWSTLPLDQFGSEQAMLHW